MTHDPYNLKCWMEDKNKQNALIVYPPLFIQSQEDAEQLLNHIKVKIGKAQAELRQMGLNSVVVPMNHTEAEDVQSKMGSYFMDLLQIVRWETQFVYFCEDWEIHPISRHFHELLTSMGDIFGERTILYAKGADVASPLTPYGPSNQPKIHPFGCGCSPARYTNK